MKAPSDHKTLPHRIRRNFAGPLSLFGVLLAGSLVSFSVTIFTLKYPDSVRRKPSFDRKPFYIHNESQGALTSRPVKEIKEFVTRANHPTVSFDAYMKGELSRRRKTLNRACRRRKHTLSPPVRATNYRQLYHRMIIAEEHKLLFGYVPKVSCTMWKTLFALDWRGPNNESLIRKLGKNHSVQWHLDNYRKAVFVREPIARLLSAWLSKLSGIDRPDLQEEWEESFGDDFLFRVRKTGTKPGREELSSQTPSTPILNATAQKPRWLNITFAEFAEYVVALAPRSKMDDFTDHFLPQGEVARACQIKYDFIGRFENLSTEGPYLFKWLGTSDKVTFPEPQPSAADAAFGKYVGQLSMDLLLRLFNYYRNDYEMFGYSMEETMKKIYASKTILVPVTNSNI